MKILVVSDDGLSGQMKVDFTELGGEITRLSFLEDASGKGTHLEIQERGFLCLQPEKDCYVTDLMPVNAIDFLVKVKGGFDLAVIGVNKGLNLGERAVLSSSSVAMARVCASYGIKSVVVSLDTQKDTISKAGTRKLCSLIKALEKYLDPAHPLMLNFVCEDPVYGKYYTVKNWFESSFDVKKLEYVCDMENLEGGEIVHGEVKELGLRKGTLVFSIL